jgi:hypothetical protein
LSSLLEALAAVYRVRPGLWHDKEAPLAFPYVTAFMSHVRSSGANRLSAPPKHQWHCMPLCGIMQCNLACIQRRSQWVPGCAVEQAAALLCVTLVLLFGG